jgi:hypothetical protein
MADEFSLSGPSPYTLTHRSRWLLNSFNLFPSALVLGLTGSFCLLPKVLNFLARPAWFFILASVRRGGWILSFNSLTLDLEPYTSYLFSIFFSYGFYFYPEPYHIIAAVNMLVYSHVARGEEDGLHSP